MGINFWPEALCFPQRRLLCSWEFDIRDAAPTSRVVDEVPLKPERLEM